jgi:hypothetical protein
MDGTYARLVMYALGHVWTAPWQELSDAAADHPCFFSPPTEPYRSDRFEVGFGLATAARLNRAQKGDSAAPAAPADRRLLRRAYDDRQPSN